MEDTDNNQTDFLNISSENIGHISPYSERPETYIVPVVFAIVFLVGVIGNGTLVLIFARHRNMRNVPNTYIFSLALGDLLVILSCVPFTSTVYTFESWPYGELICKISETTKDVSIGVSVYTLTVLSADRFFAIVDPVRKLYSSIGGRGATRSTVLIAASVWVLAFVCALPAAISSYIREFKVGDKTLFLACYPFPEEWGDVYPKTVVMVKFLFYYAIPLTIIAIFYSLMARQLILSTRNMPGEVQGQARQIRARKKVVKTVLTFVLVFAVCFFPNHIFMLWFYFHPNAQQDYNGFWHYFRIVGFCFSYLNSCINPIALYCVSGTFRKQFDRYLFCCRKRETVRRGHTFRGRTETRKARGSMSRQNTLRKNYQPDMTLTTLMNGSNKNIAISKTPRNREEITVA